MENNLEVFTDEQSRVAINLAQQYQVWMDAKRRSAYLPYGMAWKTIRGRQYLYQLIDRAGNGKSLGPRSLSTEAVIDQYKVEKAAVQQRADLSAARMKESSAIYRCLRMPVISVNAAKILRDADRRGKLDGQLMVTDTNAMPAYALEANGFILGAPQRDEDLDVELLVAPSRSGTIARGDRPVPVPLPEQEWLLLGRPVDHVVVARDGSPARIVAPDPRWFSLQKLWMSVQAKRDPLKRLKDQRQGTALLNVIQQAMPHYPMDAAFEADLPDELRPHYDKWRTTAPKPHAPEWG